MADTTIKGLLGTPNGNHAENATEQTAEVVPAVTLVPDHATGEAVDLRDASDERIVDYIGDGDQLVALVKAHQEHARAELVRRMDRATKWTRRIGDPARGVQFELNVPSPDAGTVEYRVDELLEVLRDLVAGDVVSQDAAESALQRTVSVTVAVPLDENPEEIADALRKAGGDVFINRTPFRLVKATTESKPMVSRVDKLRKVKAAAEAIAPIAIDVKPDRKLRIKRVKKDAS